jgi:hypothetical protein
MVGLALGVIDVHSTNSDWYNPESAYFIAGIALGLRHAGRAWQAWIPLGGSLYLIHRAAIAYGYSPPYVEADAASALQTLKASWPTGAGLVVGALARFAISGLFRLIQTSNAPTNPGQPDTRNREIAQHTNPAGVSSRRLASIRARRLPPQPFTVRRLMVIVLLVGIHLAFLRSLLVNDPFFGFGTLYSKDYSETRFTKLQVGMSPREVEAIIGPPLCKVPWNQSSGAPREEMWYYSNQPNATANFARRWLHFENGKVVTVINDFWID